MQIEKQTFGYDEYVDPVTGEVIVKTGSKTVTITKKVKNHNEFIMVYLEDMSPFLQLKNSSQIGVLALMWRDSQYNNPTFNEGNIIAILKDDKEKWAKELNVGIRTIEGALTELSKKGLIQSITKGKYRLNANVFWKGSNNDREQHLKLNINYKIDENK